MTFRERLRRFLFTHTTRTLRPIPEGRSGGYSKIIEEVTELADAIVQRKQGLAFVEACDVIDATLKWEGRRYHIPGPLVLLVIYARRVWKPVRNALYHYAGLEKEVFNG